MGFGGLDLAGGGDSFCWVLEQASWNKNNAGSPIQAWPGVYVLQSFSFSCHIWYSTISKALPPCTRYTL